MEAIDQAVAVTCKNCDTIFEGNFCPHCSQKANTHRFTLKHFLHDFFHAWTHTDKGALFLIREMFFKPGVVVREYISGKRKKYFNPLTFFVIATTMQVLITTQSGITTAFTASLKSLAERAEVMNEKGGPSQLDQEIELANKKIATVDNYSKLLTFLFLPILAFFTWVFFRRAGFNYAENLVLNVTIAGQMSVYFIVFIIVPFMIVPSLVILWMMLYIVITWVYSFKAYRQFFGQRWAPTILKGITLQILYMIAIQFFSDVAVAVLT